VFNIWGESQKIHSPPTPLFLKVSVGNWRQVKHRFIFENKSFIFTVTKPVPAAVIFWSSVGRSKPSRTQTYFWTPVLFLSHTHTSVLFEMFFPVNYNCRVDFIKKLYFFRGFQAFTAGFDKMTKISNFTPFPSYVLPSLTGSCKCIHMDDSDGAAHKC